MAISLKLTKKCKNEREMDNFEVFIDNLDQYMGKPRHVSRVGHVDFDLSLKDNTYTIDVRGDEEAVCIASEFIQNF